MFIFTTLGGTLEKCEPNMTVAELEAMTKKEIAIFMPCLIDQVYPEMGLAMVRVLERLGHTVRYHREQTCCGQPAFNAGHHAEARKVAEHFLHVFENDELIVCPSGSCTGMVRNYYPELLGNLDLPATSKTIGNRLFEFSEFLVQFNGGALAGSYKGRIGFHNSCHSARELRIKEQPLALLRQIEGCEVVQAADEPVCCGFGGLFSFKFEAIAATMATSRLEAFAQQQVEAIVSNDPGCIMHLWQEAQQKSISVPIYHLAEFLDIAVVATREA